MDSVTQSLIELAMKTVQQVGGIIYVKAGYIDRVIKIEYRNNNIELTVD